MSTITGTYEEDLAKLAQKAFDQARRTCGDCLAYHGVWGYQRLARRNSGLDSDGKILQPLLGSLISKGRRRVLLAGSADTGQLAMVLRAAGRRKVDTTIVDRCETPLALCREFAESHGVCVSTREGNIASLGEDNAFDIVLAHSVLSFLPDDLVLPALAGFAAALGPNGRLVMTTALARTKPPIDPRVFANRILMSMSKRGLEPPIDRAGFCELLEEYAKCRQTRGAPFSSVDDLGRSLSLAGFTTEQVIDNKRGTRYLPDGTVSERVVPGVIVVARRTTGQ
ncbi:MAG: class I SAM-dependent methyltransferase [Pseudomonadota bacterium]